MHFTHQVHNIAICGLNFSYSDVQANLQAFLWIVTFHGYTLIHPFAFHAWCKLYALFFPALCSTKRMHF